MNFKLFQGFSGFQNIYTWKIYTWKAPVDFTNIKYSWNSQIPLDRLVVEFKFVLHLPFCFPYAKYKHNTLVWHSGSYLSESGYSSHRHFLQGCHPDPQSWPLSSVAWGVSRASKVVGCPWHSIPYHLYPEWSCWNVGRSCHSLALE